MTASLGFDPVACNVHLTKGADFDSELQTADDSDWDASAVISIVLGSNPVTTWVATLDGSTATWHADAADVAALYKAAMTAEVTYSDDSGAALTWFIGNVVWHG